MIFGGTGDTASLTSMSGMTVTIGKDLIMIDHKDTEGVAYKVKHATLY